MKKLPDKQKRAEIDYPLKLSKELQKWEYTKPFGRVKKNPTGDLEFPFENANRFTDFSVIVKMLNLPYGSKILDVGCGGGWASDFLSKMGYEVVGIDISPHMINLAKKRKLRNARFLVQDAEFLNLKERFDGALFYSCLHHIPNKETVLSNIYNVLKENGKLVLMEAGKKLNENETTKKAVKLYGTTEEGISFVELRDVLERVGFKKIENHSMFEFILPEDIFKKISLFIPFILRFENQHKMNITCNK